MKSVSAFLLVISTNSLSGILKEVKISVGAKCLDVVCWSVLCACRILLCFIHVSVYIVNDLCQLKIIHLNYWLHFNRSSEDIVFLEKKNT